LLGYRNGCRTKQGQTGEIVDPAGEEMLLTVVLFSVLPLRAFAYIALFAQWLATRLALPPAHGAGSDHNT